MSPTPTSTPVRWGILATGAIAEKFALGLREASLSRLVAVGSRTSAEAERFATAHGISPAHTHGSCEELLADPEVEAVYIATPHPAHAEWAIKAARAGKHILCEKPAGMNHAEGLRMIEAARAAGVLFMEAFMYRCHPQTAKLVELVRAGTIGRVRMIRASFGFLAEYEPGSRIWEKTLGGGAILDIGCYPLSLARLIAGAANDAPFADPLELNGTACLHPIAGVDELASASLLFPGGIIAQISTSLGVRMENNACIYGTHGRIEIPHPWIVTRWEDALTIRILRRRADAPEIITTDAGNLYALEADTFAAALRSGGHSVAAMSPEDTLGNLAALDRWRAVAGLRYEGIDT